MAGYIKVIVMGRLCRPTEIHQTEKGTHFLNNNIAYDTGWGDNKKSNFLNVTFWGPQAEFVSKHFNKGDGILIDGILNLEQWEKDGEKKSQHKLVANEVSFPIGKSSKNISSDEPPGENQPAPESVENIPF